MENRDLIGILVIIGGAWLAFRGIPAIFFSIVCILEPYCSGALFGLIHSIGWAIMGPLGMIAGVLIMKRTNGGLLALISGIISLILGAMVSIRNLILLFHYYDPFEMYILITSDIFFFCAIPSLILVGGILSLKTKS